MFSGNQKQLDFRDSSSTLLLDVQKLITLQDLLTTLAEVGVSEAKLLPMLGSTAAHLQRYLDKSPDQIKIETLKYLKPGFVAYLQQRHYQPASVRSYTYYLTILGNKATELGFTPEPTGLAAAWDRILQWMPDGRRGTSIASYAISLGKMPAEFGNSDLKRWFDVRLAEGRSRTSLMVHKAFIRREICKRGLSAEFPLLSPPASPDYAVPLRELPEPLKSEVEDLRQWKTKPTALGRPRRGRVRAISAQMLVSFICQIAGYVRNIKKAKFSDFATLNWPLLIV